jgi:eukaryotic-like serine/threonine-protein kinase
MTENICPQCKATNRNTARFCAECGAPLLVNVSKQSQSGKRLTPSLNDGAVLGDRYRIERKLGRGGFGAVYKAWDNRLSKPVALKENLDTSSEAQRQFTREATTLANISHPHLPRVIDHFIIPDQGQYLVMDFVEGEDLDTLLQRPGSVSLVQAVDWISQVCDALEYLHTHEPPVLHRDIKPANIRVSPKGKAMLVDFGLVKISAPHLKTTMGARAVTPGFSPPEQYGLGTTDARTDLYALGATLYRLVTNHDPLESVQRVAGEELLPVRELNPQVPVALAQVIECALAMDPAMRYQSAAELHAALRSSLAVPAAPPPLVPAPARDYGTRIVEPPLAARTAVASVSPTRAAPAAGEYTYQSAGGPAQAAAPVVKPAQAPSGSRKWIIGAGVALLVVVCLGAALLAGGGFAFGRWNSTQSTSTARAQATLISRLQMTSTALQKAVVLPASTYTPRAELAGTPGASQAASPTSPPATKASAPTRAATVTRSVNTAATASAQATQRARDNYLATLTANKSLLYGPHSGRLMHQSDGYLEATPSTAGVRNFVAEIKFSNPYPLATGDWGYGMIIRSEGGSNQFRLYVTSDKDWEMTLNTGSADGKTIEQGTFSGLNISENGSNTIRVIAKEDRGWLYINDVFVSELDLSGRYAGSVYGFIFREISGEITPYEDFTVWKLTK